MLFTSPQQDGDILVVKFNIIIPFSSLEMKWVLESLPLEYHSWQAKDKGNKIPSRKQTGYIATRHCFFKET